jgi:hypothetical protein
MIEVYPKGSKSHLEVMVSEVISQTTRNTAAHSGEPRIESRRQNVVLLANTQCSSDGLM